MKCQQCFEFIPINSGFTHIIREMRNKILMKSLKTKRTKILIAMKFEYFYSFINKTRKLSYKM